MYPLLRSFALGFVLDKNEPRSTKLRKALITDSANSAMEDSVQQRALSGCGIVGSLAGMGAHSD